MSEYRIRKKDFLNLPADEVKHIVQKHEKPKTGIFVADGTRRLVMCQNRFSPTSDDFYKEYTKVFVDSLMKSLKIFFEHGLQNLFFPLFGPSLLLRKNKFQTITIPTAYQKIFLSDEWLNFYRENGIRLKAYGDLSQLNKIDTLHLNMADGIKNTIEATASNDKHTLYFGFMSENTPCMEMPEMIINFYKSHQRPPDYREMLETYYGEPIRKADFVIFSDKLSHRALPPFISTRKSKIYYLPVPGYLGFNERNYRRMLYDLLFVQPVDSIPEYAAEELNNIESLRDYYATHQDTIVGVVEKSGNLMVPGIEEIKVENNKN